MLLLLLIPMCFFVAPSSSSFTPAPMPVAAAATWNTLWQGLFRGVGGSNQDTTTSKKRQRLKDLLLEECRKADATARLQVEAIMDELTPLSPVTATASSPLLQKKWVLEFTTEKEINWFFEQGFSNRGSVYQAIEGSVLENMIPFVKGGGLGVTGKLVVPSETGRRTNFVFSKAALDLGRWGKYSIPPIGKGWFDTIYLDEDLRVDVNSRDDILICTAAKEPA